MGRMNWQDVPLRAINFSSFWLANFAEGARTVIELTYLSNKNKYKISQETLLKILEELVQYRLVDCKPKREPGYPAMVSMVFVLNIDATEAIIADFKKDNLTF